MAEAYLHTHYTKSKEWECKINCLNEILGAVLGACWSPLIIRFVLTHFIKDPMKSLDDHCFPSCVDLFSIETGRLGGTSIVAFSIRLLRRNVSFHLFQKRLWFKQPFMSTVYSCHIFKVDFDKLTINYILQAHRISCVYHIKSWRN